MDPGLPQSTTPYGSTSYTGHSSGTMAEIAARVVREFTHDEGDDYYDDDAVYPDHRRDDAGLDEEEGGDSDSDFDFTFAVPGGEDNSSPISAGEIFCNGEIKPLFPVFNTDLVFGDADWRSNFDYDGGNPKPAVNSTTEREESSESSDASAIRIPLKKLLISERETSLTASASCSSSEADDLEGANPETYCVWTPPKEEMSKKSKSTGSSKRWKLRNLVHRSHSDGRDSFVFLAAKPHEEQEHRKERFPAPEKPAERSGPSSGRRREEKAPSTAPMGKAHREHYLKNRAMRESDRKKSYLPYRQDLVGFFSNVNGLSRTVQPF